MSADNGIYVLETPNHSEPFDAIGGRACVAWKEYRVAELQAIQNITYGNPAGNPIVVIGYFGTCNVFKNREEAWEKAKELYETRDYFEYGICDIVLPYPFDYYRQNFSKALVDLKGWNVVDSKSYRSDSMVNKTDDMVRVTIDMPVTAIKHIKHVIEDIEELGND